MFSEEHQLADLLNQFNTTADTGQNRLVYSEQWLHNQKTLILLGQKYGAKAIVDDYGNVSLIFLGRSDITYCDWFTYGHSSARWSL